MSIEEAFLDAIEREPEEEAHRLVYADWLDEQGQQTRAELLRVQCALVRLVAHDARVVGLRSREQTLLAELLEALPAECRSLDRFSFDRGLVAWAALDIPSFLGHAEKLCAHLPVRSFQLSLAFDTGSRVPDLTALVEHPYFKRVRRLDLQGSVLFADDIRALAETPAAAGLMELHLSGNLLGADGVEILGRSPYLDHLSVLGLGGNALGDAGVSVLVESPFLSRLSVLELDRNSITDRGLAILADSPFLARLRLLDLSHNALTDIGAAVLSRSPHVHLTGLNLASNFLSDSAVYHLGSAPFGERLRGLDLHGNQITPAGVAALGRSPYLNHLLKDHLGR